MCTVTLVPCFPGIRLACNRDEQRSRPAALPPRVRRLGDRCAVFPTDPVSDGTWVAASDAGLTFALLNVNAPDLTGKKLRAPTRSRGAVIPALLESESLGDAVEQALTMDVTDYDEFRLVLVDQTEMAELRTVTRGLALVSRRRLMVPALFTSSGLGDERVEQPRRQLFKRSFTKPGAWRRQQAEFHRHRWPDRPELSVCMERPDARTVSHTVVEVLRDAAVMTYWPDGPVGLTAPATTILELSRVVTPCGQR